MTKPSALIAAIAATIVSLFAGVVFAADAAPLVRIAKYADGRAAAISYTFDDNLQSRTPCIARTARRCLLTVVASVNGPRRGKCQPTVGNCLAFVRKKLPRVSDQVSLPQAPVRRAFLIAGLPGTAAEIRRPPEM